MSEKVQPLQDSQGSPVKVGDVLYCTTRPEMQLKILEVGLFCSKVHRLDVNRRFTFANESIREMWAKD